ncbi:MAG: 2-hydroxyacyl-CoA dehydratase [Chloroflexi bacterium]|nr:2-hydroxyacyl-CoA dehydratase [Chloroflexota bacterium]
MASTFDMKTLEARSFVDKDRTYKVKPLDCWAKMKELRRDQVKQLWNAKKEGKVLILGLVDQCNSVIRGLGPVSTFTFGPYFGKIMDNTELTTQCAEATEARGFGPDTCATLRIQLGSVFLGFHNKGRDGVPVVPDFCLEMHQCDAQSKVAREISEWYGIPFFAVEMPPFPRAKDYLMEQLANCIEWMSKVTGRPYDDELFIDGVYNEWRTRVYYARTCELLQNVPAPLDQRMLASFNILLQVRKMCFPEVANLLKELYEETKERVREGISALGVEKARLFHEGMFQQYVYKGWPQGGMARSVVDYGAIFIGSRVQYGLHGAWKVREDGTWAAPQTLEERGITLRTREEALRHLAELYTDYSPQMQCWSLTPRVGFELSTVKQWHVDGVVLNLDRTCHGNTPVMLEQRMALQKLGVPAMVYEASSADPREFDRVKTLDALDAFLESMGLHKSAPSGK